MALIVSKKIKIKYDSIKAVAGKFPNGTATMIILLAVAAPLRDWAYYCGLTPDEQLTWEEKGDELNKSMLYLMNSKNKHAKKDLRLAYS